MLLYLHERVRYRHGCNDHDIHKQRKDDDALIEAEQFVVLLQAVADQVRFDCLEKVPIQQCVDNQIDNFLDTIPDLVDQYIPKSH